MKIKFIKNTASIIALAAITLLLSNCTKQPEACLTASKKVVSVGESINFTSCSENTEKAVWNFGDGSAEIEGNTASKSFNTPGNYLVELRTFSKKDKKWDRTSVLIQVKGPKKRFLKRIRIEAFPNLKPDGSTWDAILNTDPDIFVSMRLDSSNYSFNTSVVSDAKLNQLPLVWEYSPLRILLVNAEWKIQMRDDDQIVGLGGSELMAEFTSNLATAPASNNMISLTQVNATIKIEFSEED